MTKKDIKEKIQQAILSMMKGVDFSEKEHLYKRKSDGVWLQGVSTVSSIIPKPWLSAWGGKEAVKFLGYSDYDAKRAEEVLEKIRTMDVAGYMELLKEAKGASSRKSKKALVDGKKGHKWLEKFVLANIRKTELPEIPTDNLMRPVQQFIKWYSENIDYPIASEAMVAYPEKGYAGTLDFIAMMKTGKLALIDFKFASHISFDTYLQCAGYMACFEPYDIKIDQRIIIRLPKTLEIEEWDKKTRTYKKVANNLEVKVCETNYEFDRDVFFACLPVKKWINCVENLNK